MLPGKLFCFTVIPLWLHYTLIFEIILNKLSYSFYPFQHRKMVKVKREVKYRLEIKSTISKIGKTPQIPIATSQKRDLINSVMRSASLISWRIKWTIQLIDWMFYFSEACVDIATGKSLLRKCYHSTSQLVCSSNLLCFRGNPFGDSVRGLLS